MAKTALSDYMQAKGLPSYGNVGLDRMEAKAQIIRDWALRDPRVQQLMQSGGSGWVSQIPGTHDSDVKIEHGQIVGTRTGGLWKPILAGAAVAGSGMLAGALLPAVGAAGGGSAALGPVAAGGGTTAAAVPAGIAAGTGGAGAAGTMAAGGGAASLFREIAKLAAPLAGPVVASVANRGNRAGNPQQDAQMGEILDLMKQRIARTTPVHEAAMRMAMSMAPTGNSSPRMAQAIQNTSRPLAQAPINPQISEAIQRLMGGR
jgi:hypothetical protein